MIMDEKVFNKKSAEKIKSPENIDEYIKVSNPSVWLLLISIVVLLLGATFWGIFGRVDSTVATRVIVQDGNAVCYVSEENITRIEVGMTVEFENIESVIESIGEKKNSDYVCNLQTEATLTDGIFDGKVIIESYTPWSFAFN